jgi:hypothetical protein
LASIKTEAVKNDPSSLKRRIAELEKQVREKPTAVIDPALVHKARSEGFNEAMKVIRDDVSGRIKLAKQAIDGIMDIQISSPKIEPSKISRQSKSIDVARPEARPTGDLGRAEQRVVDAISFWSSVGTQEPTKPQVAAVSGYSVRSSGFDKTLSILSTKGIIVRTGSGVSLANGEGANPPDFAEAKNKFLSVLGGAQRRVVDAFGDAPLSKEEVAERSGYSITSSGFEKTLSQLSSINVVVREGGGVVRLSDWVMELLG